jgi:excisionase family DNA binding protein
MSDHSAGEVGRFLSLTDVAEVLSLTAAEVMALVRSGELPAIRLGAIGQWRVEHSVLESFIADKYEETRRMALWNEAEFADVAELFGDARAQRRTTTT